MKYKTIPFPFERRFVIDSMIVGESIHPIHGLVDVDVTRARRLVRESDEDLSWTAYVVACVARSAAKHPRVHALRNLLGRLVVFENVNVATIVETEMGGRKYPLPVVLENAESRSVADLSREIREAQSSPRDRSMMPANPAMKLVGYIPGFWRRFVMRIVRRSPTRLVKRAGSLGVTAVGMFGNGAGYGIPYPTVHSMGVTVGGIVERPRFVSETDNTVERGEFMQLTLTFDHDVVDGAPAARFASDLIALIESGELLTS